MNTKDLGNLGENLACEYLVNNGYNILGRNYRINFGEIDIIAQKKQNFLGKNDKTIHFVEVKALGGQTSQCFYPEEHVNYKKQNKLKRLAEIWLSKNKVKENTPYQIDIIAVSFDHKTNEPKLNYFENIASDA